MSRLILVPQYPTKLRYQEWFFTEFENQFKNYFDDVIVLGKYIIKEFEKVESSELFSPIKLSIDFECQQIKEYMNLKLYDNDILLLMDISFPGIFSSVLYHKKLKNMYVYCHGTSKNKYDYFMNDRKTKFNIETSNSKLFKKIFVATEYHKNKLKWKNIEVIGLPNIPFSGYNNEKEYDIVSVSRICKQKINKKIEKEIENTFTNIIRPKNINNWTDYYKFLSKSKILISTSKEETFGFVCMDAILNNCIPVCPNKLSFPELLPKQYLYNDINELKQIIELCLSNKLKCPEQLSNQNLINNFFPNIIKIMKENIYG